MITRWAICTITLMNSSETYFLEWVFIGYVINEYCTIGQPIVDWSQSMEPLLSGRVPYSQIDSSAVEIEFLLDKRSLKKTTTEQHKLSTKTNNQHTTGGYYLQGANVFVIELVLSVSKHERRLAHAPFAQQDHFKVLRGRPVDGGGRRVVERRNVAHLRLPQLTRYIWAPDARTIVREYWPSKSRVRSHGLRNNDHDNRRRRCGGR